MKKASTLRPAARTSGGMSIMPFEVAEGFPNSIRIISQKGYRRVACLAQQPANDLCFMALINAEQLWLVAYFAPTLVSGLQQLECC
jgi:hypothetical protein